MGSWNMTSTQMPIKLKQSPSMNKMGPVVICHRNAIYSMAVNLPRKPRSRLMEAYKSALYSDSSICITRAEIKLDNLQFKLEWVNLANQNISALQVLE